MGRKAAADEADRFLAERAGHWHYKRKVPASVVELDERAPMVRISLKTSDLAEARRKRDVLQAADNELWAALLMGGGAALSIAGSVVTSRSSRF